MVAADLPYVALDGVARHDAQRADGSWRDAAAYSIVAAEWSAVRAGLEARLAGNGRYPQNHG